MEDKIRTKDEWLAEFDKALPKFKWFIHRYTNDEYIDKLVKLRTENDTRRMVDIMNNIWFILPDHIFNIIENPDGWSDFLHLIEFYSNEEATQIMA